MNSDRDRLLLAGSGLWRRARNIDVAKTADWGTEGKINIDDLTTHVMPLEKINDGFDLMHKGASVRNAMAY